MRRNILAFTFLTIGSLTALAQGANANWVGTWAASPIGSVVNSGQPGPANSTYRSIVHISIGGPSVRVQLTNEFGTEALKVGAADIATSSGGGSIQPGSDHALTFNGKPIVEIPAGALVLSDPVAMPATPLSDLVVSIYLPDQQIRNTTCHTGGHSTNYVLRGNASAAPTADNSSPITSWCFVKGIDVSTNAADHAAAIVTFGDSITDGAQSTYDMNRRWPDVLAARLQADKKTAHLSVLNQGIGGNRVLHDGYGPSALARFDRDVIAQSGAKYLIILEGINDIGRLHNYPDSGLTAADLISALNQMIVRAHAHGIAVIGCTLTPYHGAGYYTENGEAIRKAVNDWIRNGGAFDGVADLEAAVRDPNHPDTFLPANGPGDHLHPNDAGYKAMGDAIDLKLFTLKPKQP